MEGEPYVGGKVLMVPTNFRSTIIFRLTFIASKKAPIQSQAINLNPIHPSEILSEASQFTFIEPKEWDCQVFFLLPVSLSSSIVRISSTLL
jgi:hypothetical protein